MADLTPDRIRGFVIAGHGDLETVKAMLAASPELLNTPFEWRPGDFETAIQGAAHVGQPAIAEYLLAQGAPLELCTAAMLGRRADVERLLAAHPDGASAVGAHGIPLLAHAALSGDAELVADLWARGARAGASMALHHAARLGHAGLVRWLLDHADPDLGWRDFQGKTALESAMGRGDDAMATLLRAHGAVE